MSIMKAEHIIKESWEVFGIYILMLKSRGTNSTTFLKVKFKLIKTWFLLAIQSYSFFIKDPYFNLCNNYLLQ